MHRGHFQSENNIERLWDKKKNKLRKSVNAKILRNLTTSWSSLVIWLIVAGDKHGTYQGERQEQTR